MKFIKKTLLNSSKSTINISALSLNNESTHEPKTKRLEQELQAEYEQLKSSLTNIKHRPKYQAYLESFESLLDIKNNMLNKKLETLMASLHFSGKKKQKQIPLLEAFMDFSPIERFKFLIDLIKNIQQHQKAVEKSKSQSPNNSPSKKKEQSFEQSRVKIFSQASISLNELKTMSLSYWTKVEFELNCQSRQLRVSGKQSFMLYLQNYLIRLSKNEKNCFVLLCYNPEQVPSWLRKVYVQIKKQIFVEVFQGIWNEIIQIQLQKMEASFEQVNKDNQFSPTKSIAPSSINEEQFDIDKEGYSVFLTQQTLKSYFNQKLKFTTKIKNKLKFSLYKQIEFDSPQFQSIKQKLSKISFFKAFDEKNKQIYQVKGYFNIPASVVKFKFIDSLKERNKYISSWEILENEPGKYIQAISQSYDFSQLFENQSISLDPNIFKFKQLSLKQEASDFGENEMTQILVLQSIKEISKTSVTNFLVVESQQKKNQKSELTITCEFNKQLIKRKIQKLKIDTISKQKMAEINKKIVQNFMKQMILMIFTQQKIYEQTKIQNEQQFFTICEAFDNEIDELEMFSTKSIQIQEQVADIEFNNQNIEQIQNGHQRYLEGSPTKISKTNRTDDEQLDLSPNIAMKKAQSLNVEKQTTPQKQIQKSDPAKEGPQDPNHYLKAVFTMAPSQKNSPPNFVKKNLLADEWLRLQEGGLTCINEAKIKEQKQIIKKILVKLGETILKQKNIMHVSLPVTIFKTQSQLTTVARGLSYAPLFLEPQHYTNNNKINQLQRLKKAVVFLISNSYSQINFQKPFNPILGQTVQYWIDGCPVYFEQISHHPPITSYYMLGRGYKIFGSMEPSLSMGINHAKVISHCIDNIEFEDGTRMNAGANKMLVNGTTFGLRTFNLDEKNYIYDSTNNLLALFSYGPTKKGLFTTSSEPSDFIKGRIIKMSQHFGSFEYFKWKKSDYSLKKQWIEKQLSAFEGIWSKKVFFDGEEYFNFDTQNPYELVPEINPLPSDSRYRQDLQWLIKGDLDKSQQHKERMQQAQRYDKKLRTKNH